MAEHRAAGVPALVDVREGHRFDIAALADFLAGRGLLEGALRVLQFQGGQSNPTFRIETGSDTEPRRYVLRKKPPGDILPSAHRIDREYRVMAALADARGVPVPTMRAYCDDETVIGTPFYVMDHVEGRVFDSPALPELAPEQRRDAHYRLIDTLAALHAVDVDAVGLTDFGRPSGYIERQMRRWRSQYEASVEQPDATMNQLGAWLDAHVPADAPPAIAHGDFRFGNLLFTPALDGVAAVLDWELATIGHPIADLAYACMPFHLPSEGSGGRGVRGLDLDAHGIPDEDELLARYRGQRGIESIEDWPVFVAFSMYRIAAILYGVHARALQGNASSADALEVGDRAGLMAERGLEIARGHD